MSDDLTIRLSREEADVLLASAEWDHANGAAVLRRLPPALAGMDTTHQLRENVDRLALAIGRLRDQLAEAGMGRDGG